MALLDRFRSLPIAKHPDPDVRLAHVEGLAIDEREQLASFAREDESPRVRRAAVSKIMDPAVLAPVSRDDADGSVRAQAASMLRDIALEAFEETGERDSLAALEAISDPKVLSHIAKAATRESVAAQALGRIEDERARGSVARHAELESIRNAACALITGRDELLAVALNSAFKDTAVAAVERFSERADLEQIAERSNNKNAVKRARVLLRELDAQAAPPEPDLDAIEADVSTEAPPLEPVRADEEGVRDAAEKARAEADLAARQEEERQRLAVERAAALEAAAAESRKDHERRRERLAELVTEIEAAAADPDLPSALRRQTFVQREWRDITAATNAPDEALAGQYAAAAARLIARSDEAKEADRRARREALVKLTQVIDRVETIAAKPSLTAKLAERALRDVRTALGTVPPLPTKHDYEEAMRRLKAAQAALTPKVQELREIEGWQRWANVGIQEQLCEKMEALNAETNADVIVHRVRELQQQWRQAADVPRAQGDALWQRFKAAHDVVWTRCQEHFAAQAVAGAENLQKKIALCERAEALSESTKWIQTADEIKALQAEWKTIGPVSRGQEKAVWERFRVACDRFFSRRHDDLLKRKTIWTENFAKKDALCARVEALADSVDWDATATEIKRLQAEWKTIGPVKKSRSDLIWQRFRTACDRFFARFAQRHEIARGERVAAREAICAELESYLPAAGEPAAAEATAAPDAPAELLARVRALRGRWQQELAARGVEPARAAALDERFAAAFERLRSARPDAFAGTDFDPDANRQRMEALIGRVEKLAASLRGPAGDEALSSATRLAAMLKEALASNTIGGKVEEESRARAAQEEMRQAQAAWSRIGPVAEPVRRALDDRFARACRAIADAAGGPAKAATTTAGRSGGAGGSGRPGGSGGARAR